VAFRFGPNGSLIDGEPYFRLDIPDEPPEGALRSGARGVAFDDQGYADFATALAIRICDQTGRLVGIIRKPDAGVITDVVMGAAINRCSLSRLSMKFTGGISGTKEHCKAAMLPYPNHNSNEAKQILDSDSAAERSPYAGKADR
jgi:hypothetical protein